MKQSKTLKTLCLGAVSIALALALSYLKIPIGLSFGGFGGSIDLVMIPIIVFAVHAGALWGLGAGLVFGTLKFFVGGSTAINWQSMLLDYSLAYMAVGLAGLMRGRRFGLTVGALMGCLARFWVHFVSGVTIYAIIVPTEVLGVTTGSPALYSVLYNGSYMLPNTILAVAACGLLQKPLKKYL